MVEVTAPAPLHEDLVQRSIRAFAAALFVTLCVSGPLLYFAVPHHKSLSSVAIPQCSLATLLDGTWATSLERHLREASPLTYHVRGIYCENLYALGWLDSRRIHQGKHGWMFLADELEFPTERFRADGPTRRATYRTLQEQLAKLGVATLAVVLPDKTRLYRSQLSDGTRFPLEREALSTTLTAELREAGFAVLELYPVFEELLRNSPGESLWYLRDSHWRGAGITHAALAIRAELERLGWIARLGPREVLLPLTSTAEGFPGDMVQILGIRTESTFGHSLAERRDGFALALPGGQGTLGRLQPNAPWALAGTSFAREGLDSLLPMAELSRSGSTWRIDSGSVHAAWLPIRCLIDARDRIVRGEIRPKVLIWEVPERLEVEESWSEIQRSLVSR